MDDFEYSKNEEILIGLLLAHLESAYSFIWGSHEIWEKGGGDTLGLL